MAIPLPLYEAYIVLLTLAAVLAADYFFYTLAGLDFFRAKAELEYAAAERRRLERVRGKSQVRKLGKLRIRAHTVAGVVKKYTIIRLILLMPVYVLFSIVFLARGIAIPVRYCIPFISFEFEGICVTTSAHIAVLTFIAALPVVQDDLIAVLMFKKARR
jgi:hypothetical protein